MIKRKTLITKILFFSFLFACLFFPKFSQAITIKESTSGSATLYTYNSTGCGHLAPEAGYYMATDRGIVVSQNTKSVNNILIYFHGMEHCVKGNPPCAGYTPEEMCKDPICSNISKLGNTAVLIPHTINGGSKTELSTSEIKCFLDEALSVLGQKDISWTGANLIVAGHSGGGIFVKNVIQSKYTAGLKLTASIFFDACFNNWCQDALKLNSGDVYLYYGGDQTLDPQSKNTDPASNAAATAAPNKVKRLDKVNAAHEQIQGLCLADFLTPNKCQNQATDMLNPTAPSGGYTTIAGAVGADKLSGTYKIPLMDTTSFEMALNKPKPLINIPGVSFSEPQDLKVIKEDSGAVYMFIPYLGEYISALYKYAIVVAGVLSVIMIIISGILWITAGGSSESITSAKKRIGGALIGLLIAVTSYTLLFTINPDLVNFRNLKVQIIPAEQFPNEDDIAFPYTGSSPLISGVGAGGGTEIEAIIKSPLPTNLKPCTPEALQWAAKQLFDEVVCAGPKHCAFTASRFLRYTGCIKINKADDIISFDNASLLAAIMENSGWKTILIGDLKATQLDNLPLGLLFWSGHVGVSLGNGKVFQSGGYTNDWLDLNKRGGGNCPRNSEGSPNTSIAAQCNFCNKIPNNQGPGSGRFGSGTNQPWSIGPISTYTGSKGQKFKALLTPGEATETKINCCFIIGNGINKKYNLTPTLCNLMHNGQPC